MQRKPLSSLLTLLLTAWLLAACGTAPPAILPTPTTLPAPTATLEPTPVPTPLAFTDGLGRAVSLAAPARRIVSIAPSNTEVLFAVGAGAQVVGRDEFSDYPAGALALPSVGGGWGELNIEAILALQPDLVLAAEINPPEQIQALQALGLTVYALPNPTTGLAGLYENLARVGALTGHAAEAEALVASLQARVAAVEEKIAGVESRPRVFYELDSTNPNAPWTSGGGTFIDTLLEMAGGENIGRALEGAYAQLSIEELLAQNPEVILLGDAVWGGVTPEAVAARPGWEALAAVQNQRTYPFDDSLVSRPGPRLVAGLEELARLLHPEAFE